MPAKMTNKEVADIFHQLADLLEIKGESVYKIVAYRRAADSIASDMRDINAVAQAKELRTIGGVGEAIEQKIDEILSTGQLRLHEQLKDEIPGGVISLLAVPGIGPKTAKLLYEKLGITSIATLEEAARQHRIANLKGLGPRSEEKILDGIQLLHQRSDRYPLGEALPVAEAVIAYLAQLPEAQRVNTAGSLRRRLPTIGDIDILAASNTPIDVVNYFVRMPRVREILSQGDVKASVVLDNGLQIDLMVLPEEQYGSLLQHFTGSKAHNVHLRQIALSKNLSFSEKGFTRPDGSLQLCPQEEDVYHTLGLDWIPPEIREDDGEFAAAKTHTLPRLVEVSDIKGDLHAHSNWSDGAHSVEEMALAAHQMGYQYLAITDHSKSLAIARGLTVERLHERQKEIDEVNRRLAPFRVLSGIEVDIKTDGALDLPDEALAALDVVVASVHSSLRQDRETMTARLLSAIRNPHVDIIGHPRGIILGERDAADIDFDAVVKEAKKQGVALEINANPARLDLDDVHAKQAGRAGVLLAVCTDAHNPSMLHDTVFGISMARRGWAEPKGIINTKALPDLLAWLKQREASVGHHST